MIAGAKLAGGWSNGLLKIELARIRITASGTETVAALVRLDAAG